MCKYLRKTLGFIAFGTLGLLAINHAQARTLTVTITDNRAEGSTFYLVVIPGREGGSWDDEPAAKMMEILPASEQISWSLELPDGDYAARAYVDLNNNGVLDSGAFNRPTEPFALSIGKQRDKPSRHYHESIFVVNEDQDELTMRLYYPKPAVHELSSSSSSITPSE